MSTLKRTRLITVATLAFLGGVIFASSMDWTTLLVAQPRGSAPTINMAAPGRGDVQGGFASIAEQVTPAVVSIQAERDARPAANRNPQQQQGRRQLNLPPGFEQFFGSPEDADAGPAASSGTGFIVSKDGYVLTNNHVVAGMDRIEVHLTDRRTFKARVVGRDPQTDVAVIKIDGSSLPAVTFGDDASTKVGEWVLAIGNPLGLDFTVTAGIVSAKGRSSGQLADLRQSLYAIQDFIQTDAAINPGNSGGPLVNTRGEVIGINSAIASRTGTYVGYGFAIPITLAKTVMDDIIAHGRVRRAIMGASMNEVTAEDAAVNNLKEISGAKIERAQIQDAQGRPLEIESPAAKAGLEAGDVILMADGKKIDRVSTLQRILRSHQPGDVVTLEGVRYGDKKTFKVKLTEAPSDEPRATAANNPREDAAPSTATTVAKLGISVELLNARVAEAYAVSDKLKGVVVTGVTPGSPGEGKLLRGDVITEIKHPSKSPVTTVADLQKELGKLKSGEYVSLLVWQSLRDGSAQSRVVNLRIGE
jgi:serine protease Do